jgi:cytidylate kinase
VPVITIRGNLGSGAPEIGKLVADRLRIHYVDREIIAAIASHLHRNREDVTEKEMPLGPLGEHIAGVLERSGASQGAYLPAWEIPLDDRSYLAGLEFVIRELARSQSLVIRGRGSQLILKDQPGVLHILIVAPLDIRLKRVMDNLKLDEVKAKEEMERFDNSRHEFTKRYFHAELEDSLNYDLVINTEHMSFEEATSIIANTVRSERKTKP